MSKASDSAMQEDGDESVLFDDGFSIVDDINAGVGAGNQEEVKKEVQKEKTNGKERYKRASDVGSTNSKEVVSDKELGKEEGTAASGGKTGERNVKTVVKKEIVEDKHSGSKSKNDKELDSKVLPKKEIPTETKHSTKSANTAESTLIISNDEDLGPDTATSDESLVKRNVSGDEIKKNNPIATKKVNETTDSNKVSPKKKIGDPSFVWVSNISKLVKASSLKKHFSECGKVNTAKVVTNGKVFFGYVEFESVEDALNCVKKMNNSVLGGKKILVSRTRPDVTKKPTPSVKKAKSDPIVKSDEDTKKKIVDKKDENEKVTKEVTNAQVEDKKKSEEKKRSDEKKKIEDKKKVEEDEAKKSLDGKLKNDDKKSTSVKDVSQTKYNDEMRQKYKDSRKKIWTLNKDLERSQIEIRNLRRRLVDEQKKCKDETMRGEKYRSDVRNLSDQLKQTRSDYDKELSRMAKKHKLEMEKVEYQRDNFLKQREDVKRRQEDLDREFKKLDEAKKALEHMKRSRKSRSISPHSSSKRFRGMEDLYSDHRSPPPPPKLSSEVRTKVPERSQPYYEEKKTRTIYNRLGDYADKPFSKETNGRHRSAYPGDVVGIPKSNWSQPPAETWKKPNTTTTFMKPYMERYGTSHSSYPVPSTSYYPPGTSDYSKHGHFDTARKY